MNALPFSLKSPLQRSRTTSACGCRRHRTWFRPLLLNTVSGGWCNLLRVRKSGVLSRHRHPMAVVGYVIGASGSTAGMTGWRTRGSFVYEPPGEIHTLEVPPIAPEMITFFNIQGAMIYLDGDGNQTG